MKKCFVFVLFGLLAACGPKAQMSGSSATTVIPPTAPGVPSAPSAPTPPSGAWPSPPMNANPAAIPGIP